LSCGKFVSGGAERVKEDVGKGNSEANHLLGGEVAGFILILLNQQREGLDVVNRMLNFQQWGEAETQTKPLR